MYKRKPAQVQHHALSYTSNRFNMLLFDSLLNNFRYIILHIDTGSSHRGL